MVDSLNLKTDFSPDILFPSRSNQSHAYPNPLEVLTVLPYINLMFKMKNSSYQGRYLLFKT